MRAPLLLLALAAAAATARAGCPFLEAQQLTAAGEGRKEGTAPAPPPRLGALETAEGQSRVGGWGRGAPLAAGGGGQRPSVGLWPAWARHVPPLSAARRPSTPRTRCRESLRVRGGRNRGAKRRRSPPAPTAWERAPHTHPSSCPPPPSPASRRRLLAAPGPAPAPVVATKAVKTAAEAKAEFAARVANEAVGSASDFVAKL